MNAFILIDKPAGISSFDVIRQLRKATGIRKIGHAGTLDPFATGLLVCALGQYTRLIKYAEAQHKSYAATLLLGRQSSTGDPEGEIIEERSATIGELDYQHLKAQALALQELQLPIYSAIKIDGKRAYQYARAGIELQMPMRAVQIFDFQIISREADLILRYQVTVAKGTYIRAFSEWLANEIGSIGMTTELRRTAIGSLSVEDACSLEELPNWQSYIRHPRQILKNLESYTATADEEIALQRGQIVSIANPIPNGEYAIYAEVDSELIAIGQYQDGKLKPQLVFQRNPGL